ncbi:MAG: helicase-exonuclease AddAB subunit AddA [Oscillospiraceae bacterium]|nr:helicase-exonuclease AddAB subunit AddA [Oscillospiraceae bacterium]
MAENLTPQQKQAVENRGGKLLVSAAAGSGKTKVLVDRLMGYLMDPIEPANLDDFLMITYTKAAAAELRGKIAAKLSEHIAAMPENRHLQQQVQRLYLTKISTVHAFCGDILREYAYRLDIPADFRVADENECAELREMAISQILDAAYEKAGEDSDFCAFVDTQGLGRDDRLVPEILLKVYDSARCHLDPEQWLNRCAAYTDASDLTDAGQTHWGRYLMQELFAYLDRQISAMKACAERADNTEEMAKPAALLHQTVKQLEHLRASETWDDVVERSCIDYGRLVFSKKCPDMELAERIKAIRNACKKGIDKRLRSFTDRTERVLEDLNQSAEAVRGMISLVRKFSAEFDRLKKRRRILDFGDLEHKVLDLLLGRKRTGLTPAAVEIGKRFREIMVDEYQDSNAVQDAIFTALTAQRQNCFMVGDVKQSIYQFRLADPGIFLEKYEAYVSAADAAAGEGRKVLLSSNFRSGGSVLAAVNDVFGDCMSPTVGGLHYGENEMLREGIPHVFLGEPEVELYAIQVQEDSYAEEAAFAAKRIKELLDGSHMVRQGDQLRPIVPEDIVILLRSPGSVGGHFQRALEAVGLRCCSGGGVNLLETAEIGTLRALLQTVSNPRQDIPLLAALASPIFDFNANDLAAFRSNDRKSSIFDALRNFESPKAENFLKTLEILRKEAKMNTLAQLLERIFTLTRMDSIYAAMPGGQARVSNLRTFYQLAVDFEANGRRDLSQFLDYLTMMEDKGLIAAGEQTSSGCVTLMSIHKSKGLEFPVVFLCGLSREFNRESQRAQVLCDKELGLGLSAVDRKNRVRYPTIAKRAIAVKSTAESLSEELRVLYVAMTRAKDRLIMTYTAKKLENDLADIAQRLDMSPRELLTQDVVCPGEWVLLSALQRTEAGELFAIGGHPDQVQVRQIPWLIKVVNGSATDNAAPERAEEKKQLPADTVNVLREALAFRYGHPEATQAPSKQTATQRKGRIKDQEAAEHTQEEKSPVRSWRKASFAEKQTQGKTYGSATHAALQYIRFENCSTPEGVAREIQRLVAERFITPEQGNLVRSEKIAALFATELGKKLCCGENVLREFKFSILDDGANYDPGLTGEKILLQGVVDCVLVEPDGITVIDFKTDYVTEDTVGKVVDRYRTQVETYAEALSRIYQRKVKEKLLYFFHLDRFVPVN